MGCLVDRLNLTFMSLCAAETQDSSETNKQFLEGLGEAEAGSLKRAQQQSRATASGTRGRQGWMLFWPLMGAADEIHGEGCPSCQPTGRVLPTTPTGQLCTHLQGLLLTPQLRPRSGPGPPWWRATVQKHPENPAQMLPDCKMVLELNATVP